jgi:hypothetical protein
MPYSDHVKPVKTAVDASQLDGYEALLDKFAGFTYEGETLTKAALKQMQSEFFRDLWAVGHWLEDGTYMPNWLHYKIYGHPTDNKLKQLQKDALWFAQFVEEKLKAGQIVPVLEYAKLFQIQLERVNELA